MFKSRVGEYHRLNLSAGRMRWNITGLVSPGQIMRRSVWDWWHEFQTKHSFHGDGIRTDQLRLSSLPHASAALKQVDTMCFHFVRCHHSVVAVVTVAHCAATSGGGYGFTGRRRTTIQLPPYGQTKERGLPCLGPHDFRLYGESCLPCPDNFFGVAERKSSRSRQWSRHSWSTEHGVIAGAVSCGDLRRRASSHELALELAQLDKMKHGGGWWLSNGPGLIRTFLA
jgi:hypothetical protein